MGTWKTIAGFVTASAALGGCAAVMISGLPLPGDTAWGRSPAPVASTSGAPSAPPGTGSGEPGTPADQPPPDDGDDSGDGSGETATTTAAVARPARATRRTPVSRART